MRQGCPGFATASLLKFRPAAIVRPGLIIDPAMKPTSNPKNSSLSRESKAALQGAPRDARTTSAAFSASPSQTRSGSSSARTNSPKRASSHPARPQATNDAAAPANGRQKASRKAHPSGVPSSASMDAIKADRGTTIALYALFGAVLAGVIYFFALLLLL